MRISSRSAIPLYKYTFAIENKKEQKYVPPAFKVVWSRGLIPVVHLAMYQKGVNPNPLFTPDPFPLFCLGNGRRNLVHR